MTAFADILVAPAAPAPAPPDVVAPSGPDALVLLVFNDPLHPVPGYGTGWSLVAWSGNDHCFSTGLLAHGADARTTEAAARGVAERVLAERGLRFREWRTGATGTLPIFRAQTG